MHWPNSAVGLGIKVIGLHFVAVNSTITHANHQLRQESC